MKSRFHICPRDFLFLHVFLESTLTENNDTCSKLQDITWNNVSTSLDLLCTVCHFIRGHQSLDPFSSKPAVVWKSYHTFHPLFLFKYFTVLFSFRIRNILLRNNLLRATNWNELVFVGTETRSERKLNYMHKGRWMSVSCITIRLGMIPNDQRFNFLRGKQIAGLKVWLVIRSPNRFFSFPSFPVSSFLYHPFSPSYRRRWASHLNKSL